MQLFFDIKELEFIKPAVTSRGSYLSKTSWIITLKDGERQASGEASPLADLSVDGQADLDAELHKISGQLKEQIPLEIILQELNNFPSLQFALECALLGLKNKKSDILFDTSFTRKKSGISINGLVWMDDTEAMYRQAEQKIQAGFRCIKFKVGAHDHDEECRLLEKIRSKYSAFKLEIRLDANGAYNPDDAGQILKDLHRFEIHSIEQPIRAGQWEGMGELCAKSKIKIALDEELIGIKNEDMAALLNTISPAYIILKPTLLGGFSRCDLWIETATKKNIGWWATSALEGNPGLCHIAQWVSSKENILPQGLGTGALYKNNFPAQTFLVRDTLWFGTEK